MLRIFANLRKLKHPEYWVIASVVLILPPTYFWFLGMLHTVGIPITISTQLLERMSIPLASTLVYVCPFGALLAGYVAWRMMRNGFTMLIVLLSTLFVILSVVSVALG